MLGVVVNAVAVALGTLIGLFLKKGISERISNAIMTVIGLTMILIGLQSAIKTENMLCVVVCLVVGTVVGEWAKIDDGLNKAGNAVKAKLSSGKEDSKFTEGFVAATLLFCIGSMTIVGALEAGTSHDYSIYYAKSVMDFVSAIVLTSTFGVGVICSAGSVFITQGLLVLLASSLSTVLTDSMITEMSAVGGILLLGMALNILDLNKHGKTIRVANMIPAIILPPLYLALASL